MSRSWRSPFAWAGACAVAVAVLAVLALESSFGQTLDLYLLRGFHGFTHPPTSGVILDLADLVDPMPFVVAGTVLVLVALARRHPRLALAAAVLLAGAIATAELLKPVLSAPRFHAELQALQVTGDAFPSGHSTAAMALALAALLVVPRRLRLLAGVAGGLLTLAVSFSLLSWHSHFPSDVFAGYLIAATWYLLVLGVLGLAGSRSPAFGGLHPTFPFQGAHGPVTPTPRSSSTAPESRRRPAAREGAPTRSAAVILASSAVAAAVPVAAVADLTAYGHDHATFLTFVYATTLIVAVLLSGLTALTAKPGVSAFRQRTWPPRGPSLPSSPADAWEPALDPAPDAPATERPRRSASPARRGRLQRRLMRHHALIGILSLALIVTIVLLTPGKPAFRISIATAYAGLALLALTLMIGPTRTLRGRTGSLSSDLRRDIGIWTALIGLAHVAAGLLVHLGGRPWLYFLKPVGELDGAIRSLGPLRLDGFGLANHAGLAATLILATLLALSNDLSMRRLGARRWKSLHRLNYALFALVVIHGVLYQSLESRAVAVVAIFALVAMAVVTFQAAGFRATRARAAKRRVSKSGEAPSRAATRGP
jgi:sulfoxide reductase heme-binding subunit YedZ